MKSIQSIKNSRVYLLHLLREDKAGTTVYFNMKAVVKKYNLKDNTQTRDTIKYWEEKSIEHKLDVLESLREDAIKIGLYPELDETKPRLQRVYKITSRSRS